MSTFNQEGHSEAKAHDCEIFSNFVVSEDRLKTKCMTANTVVYQSVFLFFKENLCEPPFEALLLIAVPDYSLLP